MKKIFAFVAIAISLVAVSCTKPAANGNGNDNGKQQEEVNVDLTALNALLSECKTLADAATTDSWAQKAIDDFKAVIATVEKAIPAATTQAAVDNLLAQLKTAKETFLAAEIGAIPADALAWALSFEEGSGTELKTTGKYEWTVKLLPGEEGAPKFVDGHKAGSKGLQFGYGAYGEFQDAVASVLETPTVSIACWVNTAIYENNYILSWNKWDTWKFQTQSTNKAFLTVHFGDVWIDHDGNTEIPENEWHHVVATCDLTNGAMEFYLDGELTMRWDKENEGKLDITNKTFAPAPEGTKLLLGLQEPDSETGFYTGKLDDLAFYTVALDGGQVAKLFNDQK